jgi:hypothetical protein
VAATAGWGTTLRYGLLRTLERAPLIIIAVLAVNANVGDVTTALLDWIHTIDR